MTTEMWSRVVELFGELEELPPYEREVQLTALADSLPAETLAELRSLLDAHDGVGNRFSQPAAVLLGWQDTTDRTNALDPGDVFGAYEVVRRIGEGGMGTVYEAVRRDDTRQRVALKTITRTSRRTELVSRFANERRILASLQHRNIALLFDAAVTDDGIPYFVMEYVDGVAIDVYCNNRRLNVRERLALFRQVCSAVQHAHARLVVHRDLKPDNILVTDDGTVKLLDFGIAKLIGDDAHEHTRTITGYAPLTAAYASPEQLRGEPVGTATDVYSLGVLLTRLLTGVTPFHDVTPVARFFETVNHVAPPLASSLVDDKRATAMGTTADKLRDELRGEIDDIIQMALRKEPERRYSSAEALNADLLRYLEGKPVSARPDTAFYRIRKFVRRQRALVAALAVAIVGISAGTTAALVERANAKRDATRATRIAMFLQDILGANTVLGGIPRRLSTDRLTLQELLDSAVSRLPAQFDDDPEARASLHAMFSGAYVSEGQHLRAIAQLDSGIALVSRTRGVESEAVAALLANRAAIVNELRPDSALPLVERSLAIYDRLRVRDTVSHYVLAMHTLANVQSYMGRIAAAESTLHRVRVIEQRRGKDGLFGIGKALGAIGMAQHNRGAFDSAEVSMRAAAAAYDSIGVPSLEHTSQLYSLATHLISKGKAADAQPVLQRAQDVAKRALAPNHTLVMQLGITLADVQSTLGDTASAHREARAALAMIPNLPDGSAVSAFITQWWYARMLRREQSWREAERAAREQFESGKLAVVGFPHYLSDSYWLLGATLSDVGKYNEADSLLRVSVEIAAARLGATTPRVMRGKRDLAVLALRRGDEHSANVLLAELPATTADSARQMARARAASH